MTKFLLAISYTNEDTCTSSLKQTIHESRSEALQKVLSVVRNQYEKVWKSGKDEKAEMDEEMKGLTLVQQIKHVSEMYVADIGWFNYKILKLEG